MVPELTGVYISNVISCVVHVVARRWCARAITVIGYSHSWQQNKINRVHV